MVCAVANGAELLTSCFTGTVDVVLVDLDMPEIDGLEAAEEISKRGIPVILISGHPDADFLVAEHEPIAARLTKPATAQSLRRAIELAVDSARPRRPR